MAVDSGNQIGRNVVRSEPARLATDATAGSDAALAHTGLEHAVSFASGFKHPWTGLDHMLAMLAVGYGPASTAAGAVGLAGGLSA